MAIVKFKLTSHINAIHTCVCMNECSNIIWPVSPHPQPWRAHYKRPIIQVNGDVNFARRTNAEALIYYNKNINQMLIVFDLLNEIFKYLCVLCTRACVVYVCRCRDVDIGCRNLGVKYTTRANGNFCLSITASKCHFKLNCLHRWGAYKYYTRPPTPYIHTHNIPLDVERHLLTFQLNAMPSHPLKAKKIPSTLVLISILIHTKPIRISVRA